MPQIGKIEEILIISSQTDLNTFFVQISIPVVAFYLRRSQQVYRSSFSSSFSSFSNSQAKPSRSKLTMLTMFNLVQIVQNCSKLFHHVPPCSIILHLLFLLVQTGPDSSRLVQTRPDLSRLVQTCPDLSRLVQT